MKMFLTAILLFATFNSNAYELDLEVCNLNMTRGGISSHIDYWPEIFELEMVSVDDIDDTKILERYINRTTAPNVMLYDNSSKKIVLIGSDVTRTAEAIKEEATKCENCDLRLSKPTCSTKTLTAEFK